MLARLLRWARGGLLILALGLFAAGGSWYWQDSQPSGPFFRTSPIARGEIMAVVDATGTIEPEEIVDVGAQVVGMIKAFGRDPHDGNHPIDFMSEVEEGTVLVQIDDTIYQARRD